jgi:hypothetical protein
VGGRRVTDRVTSFLNVDRTSKLHDVSEADLNDLIQAGRPEGLAMEYKRDPYGNTDADKKEALKDITRDSPDAGSHSGHRALLEAT